MPNRENLGSASLLAESQGCEYGGLETTASTYKGSYAFCSSKYGQSSAKVSPHLVTILSGEIPRITKFIRVKLYVFSFNSCAKYFILLLLLICFATHLPIFIRSEPEPLVGSYISIFSLSFK